jgi:sugar/nucleoside kinase (ribokinase family)
MANRSPRDGVVVIGELNVDAVATGLSSPPRMGSEVLAADFRLTLGSASAIFASGVARLGTPVIFVSHVGEDAFGDICLEALEGVGVRTDLVARTPRERTGVTVSLSTRRDRALVTYLGAIASLKYEHLDMAALDRGRHLHMTSYFLQTGLRPSFPKIFREARRRGLTTSFDPNADPSQTWGRDLWRVLEETDMLFLNRTEALQLTGARNARAALKALGERVPRVVVKHGPRGASAIEGGVVTRSPGFRVEALDTTGAGDSFAAGFVAASMRGEPLQTCLREANACGALSTRRAGGTAAQPDAAELRAFLRDHPE